MTWGSAWGIKAFRSIDDWPTSVFMMMLIDVAHPAEEEEYEEPWPVPVPKGWPESMSYYAVQPNFGYRCLEAGAVAETGVYTAVSRRYGWPLMALAADETFRDGDPWGLTSVWHTGLDVAPAWSLKSNYPIKPLLPGFALNTLFYALFPWALIILARTTRARRRRKRGHCPACNYDLTSTTTPLTRCPECGRAAPPAPSQPPSNVSAPAP